jgi:protein-S-isoprenylcysteine O-methyltransferase Ste14
MCDDSRVITLLRHLFAITVLPFTVTVLVPLWIARGNGIVPGLGGSALAIGLQFAGAVLLAIGVALFASSLRRFAVDGKGTLAPWDPPRALVTSGPYGYVRNPMISGVVITLYAESMMLLSQDQFVWATLFLGINSIFIPWVEEQGLEVRFGDAYREYRINVPVLIPRLRPWKPRRQRTGELDQRQLR